MDDVKKWYSMQMFHRERFAIQEGNYVFQIIVTRIPSGWLVREENNPNVVFVPYNNMDSPRESEC